MSKLPYVLSCRDCGAGDGTTSNQQARDEGWINLEKDVLGPGWCYLGVCPDCQEKLRGINLRNGGNRMSKQTNMMQALRRLDEIQYAQADVEKEYAQISAAICKAAGIDGEGRRFRCNGEVWNAEVYRSGDAYVSRMDNCPEIGEGTPVEVPAETKDK